MSPQPACTICGHTTFFPGPKGRLTPRGKAPCCRGCGSFERHRIIYHVWDSIREHFPLHTLTCLQFAQDPSIREEWFKERYISIYGGLNSMDLQALPLPDNAVDIVSCNHVLEHIPNDTKALTELFRVIRPNGFIQLAIPTPLEHEHTEDWGYPDPQQHNHYRVYGKDITEWFARVLPGAYLLSVIARDACTNVYDVVYFLSKSPVMGPLRVLFSNAQWSRLE